MKTVLTATVEINERGWRSPLIVTTKRTFYFDSAAARDDFIDVASADGHKVTGFGLQHTMSLQEAVKEMREVAKLGSE